MTRFLSTRTKFADHLRSRGRLTAGGLALQQSQPGVAEVGGLLAPKRRCLPYEVRSVRKLFALCIGLCAFPVAGAAQELADRVPKLLLVPEIRATVESHSDQLHIGDEAHGWGGTVIGPRWNWMRPWVSGTSFKLSLTCAVTSECDNKRKWTFRAGALAEVPSRAVVPYGTLALGYSFYRSRGFASAGFGALVNITRGWGVRAGISWGEVPLREDRFIVEAGLAIPLTR